MSEVIESEAEQLLKDIGLLALPVIPEVVCQKMSTESFRITLEDRPMTSNGLDGISVGNSCGAKILINSNITNQNRKRFTEAHEIGHVCLHILTNKKSKFECTSRDISSGADSNDNHEREANLFASSLLIPSALVSPLVSRNDLTWSLIRQIKELCCVSLEAAALRTVTLSKEACCLIIHKNREMWAPIKSSSFKTFIPNQPFPHYLDFSSDDETDELEPLLECDFADWDFPDYATGKLYYTSIHNPEFERTMTLLLYDDCCEDDVEWGVPHF